MRRVNIVIFFALTIYVFTTNCQENPDGSKPVLANVDNGLSDSSYLIVLKKFGKINSLDFNADNNSLLFYSKKSFDSSFLVHIKRDINEILVAYYIEMPTSHDFNESPMDEEHPAYFEGYAFTIDSLKWELITREAAVLLSDSSYRSENCRDCNTYGLAYDYKHQIDNRDKYEPFYKFLLELIFTNLRARRQPISNK